MTSNEIRVLGSFVPSAFHVDVIERELKAHLPSCCAQERIGVRVPDPRAVQPPYDNLQWHQDGGGADGTTKHMVVWASEQPTQLKTSDGIEFTGAPFDLVWFDNTRAWHRQPMGTDETRRWFLAVRCSGADLK